MSRQQQENIFNSFGGTTLEATHPGVIPYGSATIMKMKMMAPNCVHFKIHIGFGHVSDLLANAPDYCVGSVRHRMRYFHCHVTVEDYPKNKLHLPGAFRETSIHTRQITLLNRLASEYFCESINYCFKTSSRTSWSKCQCC